jgi:LPXTG-site transpeptidase (sortase) family protein
LGLVVTGVVYIDSLVGARNAIAAFEQVTLASQQRQGTSQPAPSGLPPTNLPPLETIEGQISQHNEADPATTTPAKDPAPIGLLTIERLDLKVPVFAGTDRLSLNRGAGVVPGSALPGEDGNVAVAAHRDSFFRPLKDIMVGDVMELQSVQGSQRFEVSKIFITDPLDLSVLDATLDPTLTLITCYPFHYVGFAPDRFIVRAEVASSQQVNKSNSTTRENLTNP